ncbi:MAG: phosphoribosylformylglycinamidine synthase [Clostridia bacterium]|nr:phosphoribosylformylglycinamidine synthase [Clostridia bacterium]
MIRRLFVEKKEGFDVQAVKLSAELKEILKVDFSEFHTLIRYDSEGIDREDYPKAVKQIFSEPPVDTTFDEFPYVDGYKTIVTEYLPGQYDQRADSAAQCVQLLTMKERPTVRCATVYAIKGITDGDLDKIKKYLINPVESREGVMELPKTLNPALDEPKPVEILHDFVNYGEKEIAEFHKANGFAMSTADLAFVRDYFKDEGRAPTITELKVIDTYWSDHCRHTTFLTELVDVEIDSENPHVKEGYDLYKELFNEFYAKRPEKYPCLMDVATIAAKKLKKLGKLDNLDTSDEINACSIVVPVDVDGKTEEWLIMFKNETHNHPTEIEPFGGAATCLGGAIRDPLSGRTYVYQAMRVTGAANPTVPLDQTLAGKLPQRVISTRATAGYSSYGNQIGLATGLVSEMYHENFKAKRLETGFVIAGAPRGNVVRHKPKAGDVIVLLGGETGRDGIGGATGSSKAHTVKSVEVCGAEVQKGNPLTERKLQRLFRNKKASKLVIKCNDFGAGGVSVAIGELADGLDIDLDKITKKYEGLGGTELAISESQERMAVVLREKDLEEFVGYAKEENLAANVVAVVTDTGRMRMSYKGEFIVDIARAFLDTNGVKQTTKAKIVEKKTDYFTKLDKVTQSYIDKGDYAAAARNELARLNVCSEKGMQEIFDSTIGASTVLMPLGGKYQLTPSIVMSAKPPVKGHTDTATVCSYGCYPALMSASPYIGSVYSVVTSLAKLVAAGVDRKTVRLTMQEFFKRLGTDATRWGEPLSALLGALSAQIGLEVGAIGGKDSMSGTFENIDVPPTLISFAVGISKASEVIHNAFEGVGRVYRLALKRDEYGMIDYEYALKLFDCVHQNIKSGNIKYATVVEDGGVQAAVIKSCMGNGLGFDFEKPSAQLFAPTYGDFVVMCDETAPLMDFNPEYIGTTDLDGKFDFKDKSLNNFGATQSFTSTLEGVYRTTAPSRGIVENIRFKTDKSLSAVTKIAKPRIFIPVFPGTNCEYDSAKVFKDAGAEPIVFVVKNRSPEDIKESVEKMAELISQSQMIMFPGGFSGGDEPDGSGKFIATTFRNPLLVEKVEELLNVRDGLVLGVCNGFQALIKLGLLPYGKITTLKDNSPTLTFNNITRHVSTIAEVRVASTLSPWLYGVELGERYSVPVSHGEGRFVAPDDVLQDLIANGQVATQYVDQKGFATMESPYNPNGSMYAIEGITSADGRVFGRMGHPERTGENLLKNYPGNYDMKIFESGVKYFK